MKQSTLLKFSVAILTLGQLALIHYSAQAQAGPNQSDNTAGNESRNSLLFNRSGTDSDLTGDNANQLQLSASQLLGEFGLSQEVIDLIPRISLNEALSPDGSTNDGSRSTILGRDTSTEEGGESETITICLGNPCLPDEDGGKAITLNDLAKLIEDDLNQSLSDLRAAEELERQAAYKPRRIARRRSPNACVSPVGEARREFITKLQQSGEFAEKIEPLKLENYGW